MHKREEIVLYHKELGSLKQMSDLLFDMSNDCFNRGMLGEALYLEGISRGINEILIENNIKEIHLK